MFDLLTNKDNLNGDDNTPKGNGFAEIKLPIL